MRAPTPSPPSLQGTLYCGAVQTPPFARPHVDEPLAALDFALDKNDPARGECAGPL